MDFTYKFPECKDILDIWSDLRDKLIKFLQLKDVVKCKLIKEMVKNTICNDASSKGIL